MECSKHRELSGLRVFSPRPVNFSDSPLLLLLSPVCGRTICVAWHQADPTHRVDAFGGGRRENVSLLGSSRYGPKHAVSKNPGNTEPGLACVG